MDKLIYIIAEIFQLQKSEAKSEQLSDKIDTEGSTQNTLFIYR